MGRETWKSIADWSASKEFVGVPERCPAEVSQVRLTIRHGGRSMIRIRDNDMNDPVSHTGFLL